MTDTTPPSSARASARGAAPASAADASVDDAREVVPASPAARRALVRGMVSTAARAIAPHHPLETFIARNPLAGYEDLPFERAAALVEREHGIGLTFEEPAFRALLDEGRITVADLSAALDLLVTEADILDPVRLGDRLTTVREVLLTDLIASPPAPAPVRTLATPAELISPRVHARVDEHTSRWVAAALGQATWADPLQREDLWPAWRRLAAVDPSLPRAVRRGIRSAPDRPEEAIEDALARWNLLGHDAVLFLRAHLLAQPGWSAQVRHAATLGARIDLTSLIAVRATLERLLLPLADAEQVTAALMAAGRPTAPSTPTPERLAAVADRLGVDAGDPAVGPALRRVLAVLDPRERLVVWQEAYEVHAAVRLAPPARAVDGEVPQRGAVRPPAQAVFCIDPRSEGIRRHLERVGDIETLGFAGFFAVAIGYRSAAGGPPVASCPVLLAPRREVVESSADAASLARYRAALDARHAAAAGTSAVKDSTAGPYAFAETAGWLLGPAAAARTLWPRAVRRLGDGWRRRTASPPPTRLDADVVFDADERALYAETALRMMGLVDGFARVVLLCGHGATVTNAPFASALQCGACGGHEGAPNARAAAAIFNDPGTRARLARRGIVIPDDTLFVAAQHDTVTDRVTVLEPWAIPASHVADLAAIARDLDAARAANARERLEQLPGGSRRSRHPLDPVVEVERRAADWAEAYPEWGLVGNAAMIVGPRRITAGLDLGRRAFLHSYDTDADPDGVGLETILTAPMIVAQWINAQYAASTLAPDRFGAGAKPLHNVVGTVGVLSGYGGDVRLGLPWQSVGVGRRLVHEPMRLQVFVQAPLERITAVIDGSDLVRDLLDGGWIALRARAADGDPWLRYGRYGWREDAVTFAAGAQRGEAGRREAGPDASAASESGAASAAPESGAASAAPEAGPDASAAPESDAASAAAPDRSMEDHR